MMLPVVLLMIAIRSSTADIPTIGPCNVKVPTQDNFAFDQFHTENKGNWKVVYGPDTSFFKTLKSLVLNIKPAGEGKYHTITYTTKDGKTGNMADETVSYDGNDVCTAISRDNKEFKIIILKYEPGRYCHYYVCSHEGSDKSTAYRYILAHDELTPSEVDTILAHDKTFGFPGKLIKI